MDPLHIHIGAMLLLLYCIVVWIFSSGPTENMPAKSFLTKIQFYIEGIYFMIFSKDSKGLGPKYNPDPKLLTGKPSQTKRIVFIRHGESDWNDVFNKGFGPSIIARIIKALIRETKLMVTMDSVFLDSPLNMDGIEQANELVKDIFALRVNVPTVGASGAVFGVLLAFGYLFPNTELMFIFPPVPIKAKYFVMGYGAIELYLGITESNSTIAHFAHLGGMLFGFILLKYWEKTTKKFY